MTNQTRSPWTVDGTWYTSKTKVGDVLFLVRFRIKSSVANHFTAAESRGDSGLLWRGGIPVVRAADEPLMESRRLSTKTVYLLFSVHRWRRKGFFDHRNRRDLPKSSNFRRSE